MRKIREVLRLKAEGFSDRQIAAAIGSARSTVHECIRRARDAGVTWITELCYVCWGHGSIRP